MIGFKAIYDSYKRTADGDDDLRVPGRRGREDRQADGPRGRALAGRQVRRELHLLQERPRIPEPSGPGPGHQRRGHVGADPGDAQRPPRGEVRHLHGGPRVRARARRAELGFWYTYEKNTALNKWHTTTSGNLNNSLAYAGNDKGNSFGLNAAFQIVPDKWKLNFMFTQQKIDGFMDVTANATGAAGCCSFTTGRSTIGGVQDITDYDDTRVDDGEPQPRLHLQREDDAQRRLRVRQVHLQRCVQREHVALPAGRPVLHAGEQRQLQGERRLHEADRPLLDDASL